jgi:hypothetical protein
MMKRKMYSVTVRFDSPTEGVIVVPAEDMDHAKKLIAERFAAEKNVEIVDIFDMEDAPKSMKDAFGLDAFGLPLVEDAEVIEEAPEKILKH